MGLWIFEATYISLVFYSDAYIEQPQGCEL